MLPKRPRVVGVALTLVATSVLIVSGSASARLPDDPLSATAPAPASIQKPSAMFGVLRQSPTRSVPTAVGQAIAWSSGTSDEVDPSQVRRTDVAGRALYVAASGDGVCVFASDGAGACTQDLAGLAKWGLSFQQVPPLLGPVNPKNPAAAAVGVGTTTVYGLVPDGVDAVVASTPNGEHEVAAVRDNAFVVTSDHPVVDVHPEL